MNSITLSLPLRYTSWNCKYRIVLSIVGETAQEKRNLKCHHSIVYKNLNKSGPWIYQNSFI